MCIRDRAWGRRGKGDADEYMLAGRNIGLALSTATLMASWVTGNTTLLAPEFGYKTGLWGMFSYALAGLGLILFAPLALRIKHLMPHGRTSGDVAFPLLDLRVDFRDDAVQELTEIYERSQDLWIQQWRDEMAEIPMLNRLVA